MLSFEKKMLFGDQLRIWNNSTIDYGCQIGDWVLIHNNVYVAQFTTIDYGEFLAPRVMLANDPHPVCDLCMRGPTIKSGARIGINATILSHITIGENALIGAGSVVTKGIPANTLAMGNPAVPVTSVDELPCPYELVDRPNIRGVDVDTRNRKGMRS